MADVLNKRTKEYKKSVNTPDYDRLTGEYWDNGNWIINPSFIPDCNIKYIVIEDDTIRKMTIEEKAIVDYVEPVPELTLEELEKIRNANIAIEIAIKYPLPVELALNWKIHTGELTIESLEIVEFRNTVDSAKAKYPKVQL